MKNNEKFIDFLKNFSHAPHFRGKKRQKPALINIIASRGVDCKTFLFTWQHERTERRFIGGKEKIIGCLTYPRSKKVVKKAPPPQG
jgi:hypothetical protein